MKLLFAVLLVPGLALSQTERPLKDRAHEPPSVKLLTTGAAPLKALRYRLERPQALTIEASGEWRVTSPAGSSGTVFPVLATPVRLTPRQSAVGFSWLTPSFTGPPAGSRLESTTRLLLSGLEGSGGLLAADGRGIISRFMLHPGPNDTALDAGTMQQRSLYALQMGRGMLALLAVPLPEEPVGLGARWQVERVAVRGTVSFIQVTTFSLEQRTGNRLQLSYRFGGKWDPGSGIAEAELKLAVSGGGTATVDLALPMPVGLEDEVFVNVQLIGKGEGASGQSGVVRTRVNSK